MIRRPPRSTRVRSSAASDVYKRQGIQRVVRERRADELGLGSVDQVAEDPADADGTLVGEAVRGVAAAAVAADAARADARDDHPVADLEVPDCIAHLGD